MSLTKRNTQHDFTVQRTFKKEPYSINITGCHRAKIERPNDRAHIVADRMIIGTQKIETIAFTFSIKNRKITWMPRMLSNSIMAGSRNG